MYQYPCINMDVMLGQISEYCLEITNRRSTSFFLVADRVGHKIRRCSKDPILAPVQSGSMQITPLLDVKCRAYLSVTYRHVIAAVTGKKTVTATLTENVTIPVTVTMRSSLILGKSSFLKLPSCFVSTLFQKWSFRITKNNNINNNKKQQYLMTY